MNFIWKQMKLSGIRSKRKIKYIIREKMVISGHLFSLGKKMKIYKVYVFSGTINKNNEERDVENNACKGEKI